MAQNKPGQVSPQVPFSIRFDKQEISGFIQPTGRILPFGVPQTFLVRLPTYPPMQIAIVDGEWRMAKVLPELVQAIGEWIEVYYE